MRAHSVCIAEWPEPAKEMFGSLIRICTGAFALGTHMYIITSLLQQGEY